MRILITGVAGHLGSSFARWLLEHVPGAEITGIDNLSCGYIQSVPVGVKFIEADLLDAVLNRRFDYVFHFAAYAAECLSPFIRRYNYANNLEATAAVVNGCLNAGCRRLIYTSSMAVYGRGRVPFCESDFGQPIDPYGNAKLACERDIAIAGEQHGLDWCILRPHNIYGPGQSIWQKYRNVLGLWMRSSLEGKPMLVFGDGHQRRAFSYIDDILPCLWEAAVAPEANRQIINLGGSQPCSIIHAAEICRDVMGCGRIEHREPRHEVKEAYCTVAKSLRLLGYEDHTSLHDGLEKMWCWANESWHQFPDRRDSADPFEIEVERGLYSYWR